MWLTRPLAEMEYAKYTPLDYPKASSAINDPGVWTSKRRGSFSMLAKYCWQRMYLHNCVHIGGKNKPQFLRYGAVVVMS